MFLIFDTIWFLYWGNVYLITRCWNPARSKRPNRLVFFCASLWSRYPIFVPFRCSRCCSSNVRESILRWHYTKFPTSGLSYDMSASATKLETFKSANCVAVRGNMRRETVLPVKNVNVCASSSVINSTWMFSGEIYVVFPVPLSTPALAHFRETILSSLSRSIRLEPFVGTSLSNTKTRQPALFSTTTCFS